MARKLALGYLALASPLVLALFLVPGEAAEAMFAVLAMGYPVALVVLAAARGGRLGPLRLPLAALALILEASTVAMLLLAGRVADGPWIAGLPLGMAILLYGLWLAPLPLVALTYALTFDRFELREEDLRRLEAVRRAREGAE